MRLLVTGASGQLGAYLLRALRGSPHEVIAWSGTPAGPRFGFSLNPVRLQDRNATIQAFRQARPQVVLHGAALARVEACASDPSHARRINVEATQLLTELATASGARLLFVSTDLVFDGERGFYTEADPPAPLSLYGRTKEQAERVVLAQPGHAVARLSLLFGPTLIAQPSFFDQQWAALRLGQPLRLFADEWRTPLSLALAAQALLGLAASDFTGLVHIGGPERLSRLEMGLRLAKYLRLDPAPLLACRRADVSASEPRPRDTSLDSSLWRQLFPQQPWPTWEEALADMLSP